MTTVQVDRNTNSTRGCYVCRSTTTSLEKIPCEPHWHRLRVNGSDRPVCKTCFLRYKDEGNRDSIKICVECRSTKTSMEEISWLKSNGEVERKVVPHWYGTLDRPLCKTCYNRKIWQEKYVPKNAKCTRCGRSTSVVSKYGTPIWVRVNNGNDAYICKPCFTFLRDTGQIRPPEARNSIRLGIHTA